MTYAVYITNNATGDATSATMTDSLPTGTTYVPGSVECSSGTCSFMGSSIDWAGSVEVGDTVTVTFQVTATGDCMVEIINTAVISDTGLTEPVFKQATTQVIFYPPIFTEGFEGSTFPPTGWYVLQWPFTFTLPVGIPSPTIYVQIWADDLTSRPGAPRALLAEVSYGTSSDPTTWTTWQPMVWGSQQGNNDEFIDSLTFPIAGTFYYAVRYSANYGTGNPNDEWIYADLTGGVFDIADAGLATVIPLVTERYVYLPLILKVAGGMP